uniref:Insulin-like domain-containing protein n=1 Tax=Ciona savignyi TaxID=51511 RepID=H2Z5E5_CIOSA
MKIALFALCMCLMLPAVTSRFTGGCGAKLVDRIRIICGKSGFFNPRQQMIRHRYPNRRVDRRALSSDTMSINEIFHARFPHRGPLRSLIRIGGSLHRDHMRHKRGVSRNIVRECCRNRCSTEFIMNRICRSRN